MVGVTSHPETWQPFSQMLPSSAWREKKNSGGPCRAVKVMSPKNPVYSQLVARTIDMAPSTKEPGRAFPSVSRGGKLVEISRNIWHIVLLTPNFGSGSGGSGGRRSLNSK